MPTYRFTDPKTGRTIKIDGPTVPPENVVRAMFERAAREQLSAPKESRSWVDTAVDLLPTAGGIVGGIAGGMAGGPPGAIAGSVLGGASGEGYRQTVNAGRGKAGVPTSEIQMLGQMGKEGAIQGVAEVVGQGVAAGGAKVARGIGERLMTSAVGAAPGIKAGARAAVKGETLPVVKTLLSEGVNVSERGLGKLQRLLDATNEEIATAIQGVNVPINPYRVTAKLGETAKTFEQQVNPVSDLEAISRAGQEFLETHPSLNVPEAHAVKQGTYKQLAGKYGELKGADIEAQKALARGLKDEIASEVDASLAGIKGKLGLPGGVDITAANAREGALLDAQEIVAKKVALAQRRDPMGLASLAISHPLTFLAVLMDRSPAVKSLLARGFYGPAASVAGVSPEVLKSAVAAIASSTDSPTTEAVGQ